MDCVSYIERFYWPFLPMTWRCSFRGRRRFLAVRNGVYDHLPNWSKTPHQPFLWHVCSSYIMNEFWKRSNNFCTYFFDVYNFSRNKKADFGGFFQNNFFVHSWRGRKYYLRFESHEQLMCGCTCVGITPIRCVVSEYYYLQPVCLLTVKTHFWLVT